VIFPSAEGPVARFGPPGVLGVEPAFAGAEEDAAPDVDVEVDAGGAEGVAPDADVEDGVALDIIDDASAGEIVCVDVDVAGGEPPAPAPRKTWPIICGCVSMNANVGPAITCFWARSWRSLRRGWPSEVINMATGPFIPSGTMHCEMGSGIDMGALPMSIWQNNLSCGTVPLMESALKVSRVPGATVPVLVILSGVFAGMPTLQPLTKGVTRAKTSFGVNPISNAAGTAVPVPDKRLRIVW